MERVLAGESRDRFPKFKSSPLKPGVFSSGMDNDPVKIQRTKTMRSGFFMDASLTVFRFPAEKNYIESQ
jgi:hypothetical protein